MIYFIAITLTVAPLASWRALAFAFKKFSYSQKSNNNFGHD